MPKTKSTDDAVMELLAKVQQKKEEIRLAKKKPQWKTNCTIGFNPDSTHDRVNIMTVRDPNQLINICAFLIEREHHCVDAAEKLGLEYDHLYMGYEISDWQDDLKARAAQLSLDQKQADFKKLDARVNKLVSPDQRREMELAALQDILD